MHTIPLQYSDTKHESIGRGAYSIKTECLQIKEWGFIIYSSYPIAEPFKIHLETKPAINNLKNLFQVSRSIPSKWFFRANLGRTLELERELLFEGFPLNFLPQVIDMRRIFPETTLELEEVSEKISDSNHEFTPSKKLVDLVESHMIYPDEETLAALDELKEIESVSNSGINEIDIASIITKRIEGLWTDLANRALTYEEPIYISKKGRFTPNICREISRLLELDAYNPYPVLQCLYSELVTFGISSRDRAWGQFVAEDGDLKLIFNEKALGFPNLDELLDGRWIITE